MSANQPISEWKKNQMKWKEDGQGVENQDDLSVDRLAEYFEHKKKAIRSYFEEKVWESEDEAKESNSINLKAFDLKTFKMSRDSINI